ncbi:AraC family transcriptional regulator [Bacteroides sp.]|uniref:helix-turn-helix domain-containing protein n=1 Tax=Bacteroides sp. TaxID=29523 RepID=UPI0025C0DD0A|nr:helix-turn-helix domain-containing protein [Bacteroides sp.]
MEHTDFDGIIFVDTLQDFNTLQYTGRVIHILCSRGNMSFTFQDTRYNIATGDYVILPNATLVSDFSDSGDFQGILMSLSDTFITSIAIRSNYGIIGHLSLLQNPVMKLSSSDFQVCEQAMQCIWKRLENKEHLFREELLGSLLTAHILDLYDIHARSQKIMQVSERIASLLRKFIELLHRGAYIRNRDLDFYASQLCITPHYLSEVCKKVSGKPATYWIDRFTLQEITRLLRQKELPLTAIAEQLDFSSISYFSRYVQKRIGMAPSEYRTDFSRQLVSNYR